ncbi:MAG: type II toxin-antitoxin system HipA family toxin [Candidatus Delongbacteria bacterium]|nr:type II toxin-antitoxin system HipA family toxin [Candidatus Delongbacteria bacterium]
MIKAAFVNIWGRRVGAVSWDADNNAASFEFDPSFLKAGYELSPVKMPSVSEGRIFEFPELRESTTFKGLPGLLADLLPDKYGNALIDAWLTRNGRPTGSMNPVEMLCFIGTRGMGALEIEPAYPKSDVRTSTVEIAGLISVAEKILSGRKDFVTNVTGNEEKALVDIFKIGTSAGGARAKALIAYNPKTGEVRSGQTNAPNGFSHWLIKFDGVSDKQFGASDGYGRVEMAYYNMAIDSGIEMSQSRLLEENGRAHFMTRRFDRPNSKEKVHVQTFCAMRHFDFNDVGLFGYEQLFETMRMLGLPYNQAEQLFRRMVFNVIARNCDDHTKNFAFIMDKNGTWKLSPAYDICYAYRPGSEWVSRQSLSVNGKTEKISDSDLLELAKQMNIKKAGSIISHISEVISRWNDYADQVKVNIDLRDEIEKTLLV